MPNRAAGYPQDIRGKGNNEQRQAVRMARQRLEAGKQYRAALREKVWDRSERQYRGDHWDQKPQGQDLITVNYSFGNVNVIVPYMTGSDPNFLLEPYGDGATLQNAALQEAFLNALWRGEIQGQEELEAAAQDFVVLGDGYIKVGYQIVERRVEGEGATYADVGELWATRADPWDVWIDPNSDGIHNARWVCHRFRMTRFELEQAGFANIDDDNVTFGTYHRITPNENDAPGRRLVGIREAMDGEEYAVLYEFYDTVRKCRVIFADGQSPLAYTKDVPRAPIVQMGNYRIAGSPYHMGDLEQIWEVQIELNKTRSQMITHRARGVQKFGAKEGVLSDKAKLALRSSIVNDLVEVKGDIPLGDLVQPFQIPSLSADVYNVSDTMIHDIYEISGVNEYLRGAAPQIRKTATEATIIEGASNVKAQHKLRQVEKAARKVGELLLGFAADIYPQTAYDEVRLYLTGSDAKKVIENTPPDQLTDEFGPMAPGDIQGLTLTPSPDMWQGTYQVYVEQSSTELRNPVIKEQKYRQIVMDLMGVQELLAMQGVQLDMQALITLWLDAAGIQDVDRLFIPLPPPALDPGRVDVELGEQTDPELLAEILGQVPGMEGLEGMDFGGGLAPDQVPPDLSMGQFDDANTGILPAL